MNINDQKINYKKELEKILKDYLTNADFNKISLRTFKGYYLNSFYKLRYTIIFKKYIL